MPTVGGVPTPPLHTIVHTLLQGKWHHSYRHLGYFMDPKPVCIIGPPEDHALHSLQTPTPPLALEID